MRAGRSASGLVIVSTVTTRVAMAIGTCDLPSRNAIAVTSSARHHQPSYVLRSAKHLSRADGGGCCASVACPRPRPRTGRRRSVVQHPERRAAEARSPSRPRRPARVLDLRVREQALEYPVGLDNDFIAWNAYGNRYWPTLYLIDGAGQIRYTQIGEGNHGRTETAIRALLAEARDPSRRARSSGEPSQGITPIERQSHVPQQARPHRSQRGTHSHQRQRLEHRAQT